MVREQRSALFLFAVGMVGLGVLTILFRDFAYSWQPVPMFPGRELLAVVCGLFMIAASAALLFRSTSAIAARALFVFLIIWQLLKVPALIVAPQMEAVWLGFGEIAVLLAGGWVLFARFSGLEEAAGFQYIAGRNGIRIAAILFGLALLPIGLSHLVYPAITTSLVPSWMPFRGTWAYITGVGQIACGLGVLFSVLPRAAAVIEAGMLALFAVLVWGPQSWIYSTPKFAGMPAGPRFALTAFFITWVIGASALLVAVSVSSSRRAVARRSPKAAATSSY
jgi:uncharacterized membrane protein